MELALLIKALILGIVEGLTEFLPVSSTGHLIIVGDLLNFNDEKGKVFEIVIQFGAILGVVWDYRARVGRLITGIGSRHEQRFMLNLFIAFLPAAVAGLLLHKMITTHLFNPLTVAGALIVGGILILVIERLPLRARVNSMEDLGPLDALKIGIAQTFSLFPGVSRAGATIMGGLLSGLSRTAATEFSFLLAMPVMFAATFYELFKNRELLHAADIPLFAVGFVMSFVTALVVVKAFLKFVSRHDFTSFALYRIVFGLLVLAYFW
ncbi:undecaprenyl-diphosphate phosphatase [Sulfuricaulis sp.]|jgi:undecaprenyl-diphosphatase|uniref:undecaprenyl-diphosphate phosphatase n=1 Tax=Sulfuricaulis sp. TaxID=2003553 RepID=UPI00355A78E7